MRTSAKDEKSKVFHLIKAVQELSLTKDYKQIQRIVKTTARTLSGADGASFVLRDEDKCYYVDEDAISPLWKGKRFPMEECISGWAMKQGKSLSIPDIYKDSRIPKDVYRPTFVNSLAMVPVRKKKPLGAIGIYWSGNHVTTEEELNLLESLADSTAIAMENAMSLSRLKKSIEKLQSENKEKEKALKEVKKAKNTALKNKQNFESIFYYSNIGIAVADPEGNILETNSVFLDMLEYSAEEILKINFTALTHSEDVQKEMQLIQAVVAGKSESYRLEKRYLTKSGNILWADLSVACRRKANGEVANFFGMIMNITEQKKSLLEIKEKNHFIQTILDNLPIGLALNTINEGNAIYMNKKFMEIYGWPEENLRDIPNFFKKVYPDPEYREKISRQILTDLASGDPERMKWENIEITQQSGEKRVINAVNIPLPDQNTMVSTVMDISLQDNYMKKLQGQNKEYEALNEELSQTNEELYKAKERAEESDRLKTVFLNNMSHEIRTPMNGIIGFAGFLEEPDISDEKRKQYIRIINNSCTQLLRIIDDILEISQLETGQIKLKPEAFNLNDLFLELFAIYNLQAKQQKIPLYLKKGLPDKECRVQTDKSRLIKILGNLLENAIKFTNEGHIELGYYPEGRDIIFYVKDSGIGISPEYLEDIFERFVQEDKDASRQFGGLGIGLSIARENTKLLKGSIRVESEKGKGSAFFLSLPLNLMYAKEEQQKMKADKDKTSKKKYNILVAEDEEVNYLFIETLFSISNAHQYELIHARNGQEAIDICERNKAIDLILMDIKMPVLDGHEASKRIKGNWPDIPVIAQTAYSTDADKALALESGCDDFISKPLDKKELFRLIHTYLDK